MKRILTTFILLISLAAGAASASAEPVQDFGVQLKDVTADGRYTIVFTSNSFDTTGDPPPALTENDVRFAKGIRLRRAFLAPARRCDMQSLKLMLLENQTGSFGYQQMLTDLRRTAKRIGPGLAPGGRRVLDTCARAALGKGSVKVDVRPLIADLVPAQLHLFLARPTEPGAVAALGVMAVTDGRSPVVQNNAIVAQQRPIFTVNIFDDPTPDGRYGYRLKLPPGSVGLVKISLAELVVTAPGLTDQRRTRRGGRVRTSSSFWLEPPACPASGRVSFQAGYVYETGQRSDKTIEVACPRFQR